MPKYPSLLKICLQGERLFDLIEYFIETMYRKWKMQFILLSLLPCSNLDSFSTFKSIRFGFLLRSFILT